MATYDDTVFCAETGLPIDNVIRFPLKEKAKPADELFIERMAIKLPAHIGPSIFEDAAKDEIAALNARFAALDNEDGIPEPGDDF